MSYNVREIREVENQKRRANSFTETEIKIGHDLLAAAMRGSTVGRGVVGNQSFISLYRKFVKMNNLVVTSSPD